nr:MAG TPA: fibrinogen [Caudoviricetes sp.]
MSDNSIGTPSGCRLQSFTRSPVGSLALVGCRLCL